MKIFYAVQATGNGHISRALELLPHLQEHGEVDVFLSGDNSQLNTAMQAKHVSNGLSLYYNRKGGLNYGKIITRIRPMHIWDQARKLPVENYDIVLNDFESITSLACQIKKVPSLQFGHQASFQSPLCPRPQKSDPIGEFVLHHYSKGTAHLGLHFRSYDENIVSPVVRKRILDSTPEDKDYIAVYLPQYELKDICNNLSRFASYRFVIHAKEVKSKEEWKNLTLLPVDYVLFEESMVNCTGLITGAGFETPAEALYLNKRLMVIPIQGQYEQRCNAEALKEWKVPILRTLDDLDPLIMQSWLTTERKEQFKLLHQTKDIVDAAVKMAKGLKVA